MKIWYITTLLLLGVIANSTHADSYSEALSHLKTRQLDQALLAINRSLEESETAAAYELKGRILSESGQSEAAMDSFQKVTELEPKRASVYYHIGQVYFKDELWSDAFGAYRHALELDPERKASILKMIYCLVIMENYPMAHQWLTTLDPTNDLTPDYYFARAAMAYATGTPEEYVNILRQARTIYSTQVFNRYEPELLRVVQQIKSRKQAASTDSAVGNP
ncbi:MAG: tetratricopeptide repeat protein [Verrucomicrobiota bacterium]